MKNYQQEIVSKIIEEAEGCRFVSLHDVGTALGHKHISTQDCRDIIAAVLKALPNYRVVKMVDPGTPDTCASLWTTATFVEDEVEFEEPEAAPNAPDALPDKLFYALFGAALETADRDAYISDWTLSSIWGGDLEDIPGWRPALLAELWEAAHLSIRDIRQHTGLSQAAFSVRFCIPLRTVENWEAGVRQCPDYLRLLLAQAAGAYRRPASDPV